MSYRDFVAGFWYRERIEQLPEWSEAVGAVKARINHGRWLVDCTTPGCGGADCVSKPEPFFICWRCGSPENGGKPYHVIFPANAKAIEALLLKRPAAVPFRATHRNWTPEETLVKLRKENIELGVAG